MARPKGWHSPWTFSVARVVSLGLGYQALYVDYESGSGSDKFEYKVTMYGPVVGVGFYF